MINNHLTREDIFKLQLIVVFLGQFVLNVSDAQVNFRANQYLPYIYNPRQLIHSDFNSDGKPDIAICNDNNVSIILNEGDDFSTIVNYQVSPYSLFSMEAGDFNGDSSPDLAVSFNADSIAILLNTGTGTFSKWKSYKVGTAPVSMVSSDFNKDGRMDIAVVNSFSQDVHVLLNSTTGFGPPQKYSVGHGAQIRQGDFNNDGNADLIVANNDEHSLSVLINKGNGTFEQPVNYSTHDYPTSLSVFDFDHDAFPDVVVNFGLSKKVSVYSNTGNGFSLFKDLSVGDAGNITDNAIGDFNKDGWSDIAILGYDNNRVDILMNNGNGDFTPASMITTGIQPTDIVTGDFNTDGNIDFASVSHVSGLIIHFNTGNIQFERKGFGPSYPNQIANGDFDGDGSLDLAVTNLNTKSVSILLNDSKGIFSAVSKFNVGEYPTSIKSGLLNSDSFLDLVVTNTNDNTISVLTGTGNGSFNGAFTYSVGNSPLDVAVADLNNDGKEDLVVVNELSHSISVLLNNGIGFVIKAILNVNSNPFLITTGDINNDQFPDVVLAYQNPGSGASLLLGNGDGTFESPVSFGRSFTTYQGLLIDDFTLDGFSDIGVITESLFQIFPGTGNAQFGDPITYPVGSIGKKIVRGDFDADGKKDVATMSIGSNAASVLLALDDGGFLPAINFSVGQTPFGMVAGNMNNDDKDDLVLVGWPSNYITVLISLPKLTISAHDATRIYGSPNPTFKSTVMGLINNESITVNYTTPANSKSSVGDYIITPVVPPYFTANYAVFISAGILTITKAPLTVTAKDAIRIFEVDNPDFSFIITGLVNDDILSIGYLTTATITSPVGTYAIEPVVLSGGDNYDISLVNGILTIVPVTGIDTDPSRLFSIFPNPSHGAFMVENFTGHEINYEITETNGRHLENGNIPLGTSSIKLEVPSGIYLFKLENGTIRKVFVN